MGKFALISVLNNSKEERYDDSMQSETRLLFIPGGSINGVVNPGKGSFQKEISLSSEITLGDNVISYIKPVVLNIE